MVEAMEIQKGFKKTEVGSIPNEWDAVPIRQLYNFKQGVQCPVERQFSNDAKGLKRFIRIIDLTSASEPIRYIQDPGTNHHVKKDDLFMVRYGSPGLLGYGYEGVIANNLFRLIPKKTLNNNFYFHYLTYIQDRILGISGSSTMPAINFSSLSSLLVVYPHLKAEQTAIAEALNDTDTLIVELEKLIAKKRAIKQGAMQELLTGQRRLPGFKQKEGYKKTDVGIIPRDWDFRIFGDVSYMKGRIGWQGLKQTEFTINPDDPFLITGMNFKDGEIRWDEVYHVPEDRYQMAKEIQLKKGDVLITKDGTIGKLLYVERIPYPHKATLNSHLLVFRPIAGSYSPLYLYYNLSSSYFKNHIELNKSGTTFFGISQETVSKYLIPLPPTIAEQSAIGNVLSNMDSEIGALEKKLDKYKMLKQGMMQNLLTGRIRLI